MDNGKIISKHFDFLMDKFMYEKFILSEYAGKGITAVAYENAHFKKRIEIAISKGGYAYIVLRYIIHGKYADYNDERYCFENKLINLFPEIKVLYNSEKQPPYDYSEGWNTAKYELNGHLIVIRLPDWRDYYKYDVTIDNLGGYMIDTHTDYKKEIENILNDIRKKCHDTNCAHDVDFNMDGTNK
jgi:hypothetical protein